MSQNLTFTFDKKINISAQVGDNVYSVDPSSSGGFEAADLSACKFVGVITEIQHKPTKYINVFQDLLNNYTPAGPDPANNVLGSFLMFSKNKQVNTSGISGYFAEVEFTNNSREYAELFSVGSQISESSK